MKESGEVVRGLVKSPVEFTRGFAAREIPREAHEVIAAPPPLARSRIPPATQATHSQKELTEINKIPTFGVNQATFY